jgi:amidophosphoribosyltransferase
MCGIVGISDATGNNINEELVRALTYLQHRGQDSAGIAVVEQDGKINIHKGMGLVSQVFNEQPQVLDVSSKIGVGHVRYSTQGSVINDEAQPLYTNSPYGIVLAHNGNLTNIDDLKEYLMENSDILIRIKTVKYY